MLSPLPLWSMLPVAVDILNCPVKVRFQPKPYAESVQHLLKPYICVLFFAHRPPCVIHAHTL